jgi:hypothetical protein
VAAIQHGIRDGRLSHDGVNEGGGFWAMGSGVLMADCGGLERVGGIGDAGGSGSLRNSLGSGGGAGLAARIF